MKTVRWTLALALPVASCSSPDPPSVASEPTTAGGTESAAAGGTESAAAGGTEAGSGSNPGGGSAATASGAPDALGNDCGSKLISAQATIPDMMIVLDRSGSMSLALYLAGFNCNSMDFLTRSVCEDVGVGCSDPRYASSTLCGGSGPGIDRWTPALSAIGSLTRRLDERIRFGLMVFPGAGGAAGSCAPGTLEVPLGLGNSDAITSALASMLPDGATPTGPTLRALADYFRGQPVSGPAPARKYALLVTDGEPTCPAGNGSDATAEDRASTIEAIDALRDDGIETYVVGYDAELDPELAETLSAFAQHGGTGDYRAVQDEDSLVAELERIAGEVVSCSYSLDQPPWSARHVRVLLDDTQINLNAPDGWSLSGATLNIQGSACNRLRDGGSHQLRVTIECEEVPVI